MMFSNESWVKRMTKVEATDPISSWFCPIHKKEFLINISSTGGAYCSSCLKDSLKRALQATPLAEAAE